VSAQELPPEPVSRYVTEVGPTGLKRIVRRDGASLGTVTAPTPRPRLERPQEELRLRVERFGPQRRIRYFSSTKKTRPPESACPTGDLLRARREALSLSQRDLAAASGVQRGVITDIESGRRNTLHARYALAQALSTLEARAPFERYTLYQDDLGWSVGVQGTVFIAGSFDYCLRVLSEILALPEEAS
jgi:transcriptional regulator with XRE-family HTH domain